MDRRKRWSDEHDLIETDTGFVVYSWLEREAICLESGLSEREAMRVASRDYQREATANLLKAQPNLGQYPTDSYGVPLAGKK